MVAEILRETLAQKRQSVRWLASQVGRSPSFVNDRIKGTKVMTLDHLDDFCRALDVRPSEITASAEARLSGSNLEVARAVNLRLGRPLPERP